MNINEAIVLMAKDDTDRLRRIQIVSDNFLQRTIDYYYGSWKTNSVAFDKKLDSMGLVITWIDDDTPTFHKEK